MDVHWPVQKQTVEMARAGRERPKDGTVSGQMVPGKLCALSRRER